VSEQSDPFFERWARSQRPPLTQYPRAVARVEHAATHHELATIDAELETLCARRRAVLDRLGAVRAELWPDDQRCHRRRRNRVDEVPLPPAPPGAEELGGVDLRATCVGILRRHGPCGLRELHGLLHRHGYRLVETRAVQRLADAMAYEVRQGRAVRIARGVYGAVAAGPDLIGSQALPWDDPDEDRPQVDPVVLDDPERWTSGAWPEPAEHPVSAASQVRAPDRYDPSTLDEDVRRARARVAALLDDRTVPDRWDRFVDESVPMVRTWVQRRRIQADRRVERGGAHPGADRAGGDPEPEDP
jgi:hypothetical protein